MYKKVTIVLDKKANSCPFYLRLEDKDGNVDFLDLEEHITLIQARKTAELMGFKDPDFYQVGN